MMKKSNIEWVGDIPNSWNVYPIKSLIKENKKDKRGFFETDVLSLTIGGVVKKEDLSFGMNPENYENHKLVNRGDYVICLRDLDGPLLCGISDFDGCLSSLYFVLKLKEDIINYEFFHYLMKTMDYTRVIDHYSFGMRHSYNFNQFCSLNLAFPSIDTQEKIVNFLDDKIGSINKLISIQENEIAKLKNYKKALINKTVQFGLGSNLTVNTNYEWATQIPVKWRIVPLKKLFNFEKGLPITKDDLIENGIKVISYGQLHSKQNKSVFIDDSLYRFVSEKFLQSCPGCLVKKDDFIFADTSEDLEGTCDFVHVNVSDTIFAGYHSILFRNNNTENPEFLSYVFLSDFWREQFRCRVSGVKLFSLTQKLLNQGVVFLPDIDEQKNIANYLDKQCALIDDEIDTISKKINSLKRYINPMIYEYITGKKEIN